MRLIDADTVVTIQTYDDMYEEWRTETMTVAEAIDKWSDEGCPPIVDAEPVRHGEWINKKRWSMGKWHKWLECSECNYQDYNLETYEAIPFTGPSNYCPNCGAKMDGKENE